MSAHGTDSRYQAGCSCGECRSAHLAYYLEYTRRPYPAELLRHGEASTYKNHRCRCGPCREAASAQRKRDRDKARQRA